LLLVIALSQQFLNQLFGLVIGAFAHVHPAHATLLVNDKPGGPRLNTVRIPDGIVVICNDWIFYAEFGDFATHVVEVALRLQLWRVHSDDCQTLVAIARIPTLD